MKHWKRIRALLAVILVAVMLVQMSVVAFAETTSQNESVITETVVTEPVVEGDGEQEAQIIAELTDERQEYEKRFMLSNGSMMAVQYAMPVHFLGEDGNWIQYDNRMQETSSILDTEVERTSATEYRVIESDSDVRLSKKAGDKKIVTIAKDGHQISWGFVGVNKVELEFTDIDETTEGNDKFLNLQGIVQEGWYRGAFENADLQYLILPTGVKENIILKSADAPTEFELEYKFKNLIAVQIDSKTIDLQDSEGNVVYTITAPNMQDANGVWSDALSLTITEQKNNKLRIKLSIDEAWLNSSDRAFPITVDPTFETEQDWGTVDSTTIVSGHPNNSYGYGGSHYIGTLYVGYETIGNFNKTRALVRLNSLPQLSPGDVVVSSKLVLLQDSSSTSIQVNAHKVTSDWEMSTATWNTMSGMNNYEEQEIDQTTTIVGTDDCESTWDITVLTREWYSGASENNGIMLISPSETSTTRAQVVYFASTFPNDSSVRPTFMIEYRNNRGLEENWSYHKQELESGSIGYVNDFSGNLVFQIPLLIGNGTEVPDITLTYNSFSANKQYMNGFGGAMGNGWKTNWHQSCFHITEIPEVSEDIVGSLQEAGYTYAYIDGDDTIHYFRTTNTDGMFQDEEGLGMLMYVRPDVADYYVIDGVDGSKMYFTHMALLNESIDYNYNESIIAYSGLKISQITINKAAITTFVYDSNGMLTTVVDDNDRETYLEYDVNGNLVNISYPDNTEIHIEYEMVDINGEDFNLITKIVDSNGEYVNYSYNTDELSNRKSTVSSVEEYDNTGEQISKLDITYFSNNTTLFSYEDDTRKTNSVYEFNNYGETINKTHYDITTFQAIEHRTSNGEIIFKVTTLAGEYNRLKLANATTDVVLAVSDSYSVDENGNYVWIIKTDEPMVATDYTFDLRKTDNTYLNEDYLYSVSGVKSVVHRVANGKIAFTVKTVPGNYSKISVSYGDDTETIVSETTAHTVDSDGNYVWNIRLDIDDNKSVYCFDLYDEQDEIIQNTYIYDVTSVVGIKSVTHEISNGKIIFNIITDPGDYNRIKITSADNLTGSLAVIDSYTVNSKGNYVWILQLDEPATDMEYAFDVRTTNNIYLKDYYIYEVTDIVGIKSVTYEFVGDKIYFNITTDPGTYNRVKVTSSNNLTGSIAVSDTYKVDLNGNYVWTIKTDAPTANISYAFDLRDSITGRYTHEYYYLDISIPEELYQLVAFGVRNEGEIEISWMLNYDVSNLMDYAPEYSYTIFESIDNLEYEYLDTVNSALNYNYNITDDFDTKYFKVSVTIDNGRTITSVPFKVSRSGENYSVDFLDTDEDELYDVVEVVYGTNVNVADTDGDGLDDYQEIFDTHTDPLKYDSVTENVPDAQADFDNDGLTSSQEISLGTNAQKADSDEDGLSDCDEVNIHGTNPLNADSDGDGMSDKCELQYGTNPMVFDTSDDGVSDGEREFNVTIEGAVSENENYELVPSLSVTLSGSQIDSLSIEKVDESDLFLNSTIPGYLGEAYDLTVDGEFAQATLSFEVDTKSFDDEDFTPRIYYLDEENQVLTEVPNQTVEGNVVSANLEHFSKYIVLNKNIFSNEWVGYGILAPIEANKHSKKLNIAFVLDESSGMSYSNFADMKTYCGDIMDGLNLSDRVSVFTFNNILREYLDNGVVREFQENGLIREISPNGSERIYAPINFVAEQSGFSNKDIMDRTLTNVIKHGGTASLYSALNTTLCEFDKVKRSDVTNIMILLTDGNDDTNISNSYRNDIIHNLRNNGVVVYTVGVGSNINTVALTNIAKSTGGQYYSLNDAKAQLALATDVSRDSDDDGLSDYHEKNLESGNINFGTATSELTILGGESVTRKFKGLSYRDADSDDDGLLDGEEIKIMQNSATGEEVYYCLMVSNPVKPDSDFDGLSDLLDDAPFDATKHSFLIYETEKTDKGLKPYTKEEAPNGWPPDLLYGGMSKAEILEIYSMDESDDFGFIFSETKDDYEKNMRNWFIVMTSLSGEMSGVALDMMEHFFDGTGTAYRNDVLTEAASNHVNVIIYENEISEIINNLIVKEHGDIRIAEYDSDLASVKGADYRDDTYMVTYMTDDNGYPIIFQPKFDTDEDFYSGLGLCVHDTYGNRIEITSFKYESGVYTYTLRFTLYDIFGLDESDITGGYDDLLGILFGEIRGFRSWFILQHYDEFKGEYKPYVSYMEFEKTFNVYS